VILGAAAVYALVELITKWNIFRDQNVIESDFWFITLFTLFVSDVFNIGLRRRWGLWPLVVFLAGAAATGLAGYLVSGELWTTALAAWVYAGDLLVFAALTVSFPVAIATRTQGCELNAIPRLVARLRGTTDEETRRCILGADLLDRQPPRLPRRARRPNPRPFGQGGGVVWLAKRQRPTTLPRRRPGRPRPGVPGPGAERGGRSVNGAAGARHLHSGAVRHRGSRADPWSSDDRRGLHGRRLPRATGGVRPRRPLRAEGRTLTPVYPQATDDGGNASPRRRHAWGMPAADARVHQQRSRTMAREVTWETGTSA
jgi:hypothetical protein